MHMNVIETNKEIWLSHTSWREIFHVTGTMLQLLKLRGIVGGLAHKYPHEYLSNFVDIIMLFLFKKIS